MYERVYKRQPIVREGKKIGRNDKVLIACGVESKVVKQSSEDLYDETPSSCPNYFEKNHGGKSCEIQMNICIRDLTKIGTEWLCPGSFQNCKNIEDYYNETWERNHGKLTCG